MIKNIKFLAQDEHTWKVKDKPIPAVKKLPQWWKDMPVYGGGETKFNLSPAPNVTVKRCIPTLDAFAAGYYITLWADCLVNQNDNNPEIRWNTVQDVFGIWSTNQISTFEFENGYSPFAFKYLHGWTIKTPPGWSSLITHPIAYQNLPFKTVSGIVDTDVYDGEINSPIILKENFTGIIEKGTPMFQVIPFKREIWQSEFDFKKPNQHFFELEKLKTKIVRSYQTLIKDKKIYR